MGDGGEAESVVCGELWLGSFSRSCPEQCPLPGVWRSGKAPGTREVLQELKLSFIGGSCALSPNLLCHRHTCGTSVLYILLELAGWCCFSSSSLVSILMPGILQQIWGGWCGFCLQAEGNYWVKRSREVAVQIQWYSLRAGGWRDLRKTFQTLFIWRFCHL